MVEHGLAVLAALELLRSTRADLTSATRGEHLTAANLLPRIGEPAEVAEAYLYLMRGGYTTGQVLFVEGGRFLGR